MRAKRAKVAVVVLVAFSGCGLPSTAIAELQNSLPVDGCTWVVRVDTTEYAPDTESVARIREYTHDALGATRARISYVETGRQGTVQCGWGHTQPLAEISVFYIGPP